MKVKFTLGDSEELKSATLISRSGKATGKYKNAWNNQLDDGTVTRAISRDFLGIPFFKIVIFLY